ncbi:MAG: right-handed parallel beta-helix repeat-containing protein [Deltaproteobacteria bacterium]|nr:right-handed parallel beta-helix repeat-containing protein [Deltaproteobacteria bacterium]
MKNNKLTLAAATLMIAFLFLSCSGDSSSDSSSAQGIVYVDNSNTSGVEDGSYEHPYSAIQKAIDSASGDNTVVYVRKGSKPYSVEEGYLIHLDGTRNLALWGSGYNEGFPGIPATGYPVLQSSTLAKERPIYMEDVENISIIGLDFRGGEQNVVYAGGAKKLTIKHCIISGADPAPVWNRTSGILIYSFGDGDKSSDITITDNTLYNNYTGGINVSVFGNSRYGFESTAENVLIAGNTFYQTQESEYAMQLPIICEIWCGLMENITIENNNIYNFGEGSAWTPAGIFFLQRMTENPLSKNIVIRNNNISNSVSDSDGIWVEVLSGKMESLVISGNSTNTGKGITLIAPGAGGEPGSGGGVIDGAVVTGNTITDSLHPGLAGLLLVAQEDGSLSASVSRNIIKDGLGYGVWLDRDNDATLSVDLGGGPLQSEGYNSIYNNQLGEIGIEDQNVGPQTAKYNWWGQAGDPGSLIEGDIDYTPWLTEDPN